eukprot:1381722-Amorphochlora_amoeboformis.AAC.1
MSPEIARGDLAVSTWALPMERFAGRFRRRMRIRRAELWRGDEAELAEITSWISRLERRLDVLEIESLERGLDSRMLSR